jgi:hypothetical protein
MASVRAELPDDVVEYLKSEAAKRNLTPADVLVEALGTDRFLRRRNEEGADVIVKDGNGSEKVVFKSS